jgi:hypothetical protein
MDLQPQLHPASTILSSPPLASTLISFVNEGYRYTSPTNAARWSTVYGGPRFPTPSSIHSAIGPSGIFAVIYDPNALEETSPIACAAIKPWAHDLEGHAAGDETGWEILTVTTKEGWMRRGLAARCVDALVEEVVGQARSEGKSEKVKVWIHAVEDLNGGYWRGKGWVEVRAYEKPVGH